MANSMLDARQEDDSYRRIEVITGRRRRRRWTAEEKARIVAESFEEGANISEVARRNGVVRGLLTVWRTSLRPRSASRAPTSCLSGSVLRAAPARRASRAAVVRRRQDPWEWHRLPAGIPA